jgi:hypothetical protein
MAAAAALLMVGIACSSPRSSIDREFPESSAIRVEVQDDSVLVDGKPATFDELGPVIDAAARARTGSDRKAALVLARFQPKPNENILVFERRKRDRMEAVQSALVAAGVRDLHIGPVAKDEKRPPAESRPESR